MTSSDIAMIAIRECFEHFDIDQMPSKDEQTRWRHLVERCKLNVSQVRSILSEIAAENESLSMDKIFPAFSRTAFDQSVVIKDEEADRTGKRECAYCRDQGMATCYNPRNPKLLVSVVCMCDTGSALMERMNGAKNATACHSARTESTVRQAVMLYHQHECERLALWQKRHGLEMEDRDEFFRIFKLRFLVKLPELFKPVKPNPVNTKNAHVGGLPASVNEHELAFAAYHNGDERGWE